MAKPKKVEIKEIFSGLQGQMEAKLTFNKEVLTHPVTKGDASELEWIEMLGTYLPKRYCVSKAQIIDYEGNVSEQIDIVIYDRHYSPFILHQNGATYIPAESVYAVIEVKPKIDTGTIEYASKKALSVRKLKRTSAKIIQADGREFDPKMPPKILAGILAINGKCTKTMIAKLNSQSEEKLLNFGCSLNGMYFRFKDIHPWQAATKPYELECKEDKNSFVIFFMNLLSELQKMGTVPAIELEKYLDNATRES